MSIEKTNISDLIDQNFRRNVYGYSVWIDKISYIGYRNKIVSFDKKSLETIMEIKLFVVGSRTNQKYDLDEIVIVNNIKKSK